MSSIKINVPILVQHYQIEGQKQYQLRPLLVHHPIVSHRRYNQAVAKFQNEVRHYFQDFEVRRDTLNTLLWYRFHPEIEFKILKLEFMVGKETVKGNFSVAKFILQGACFVCLPAFNHYVFMVAPDEKGKYDITGKTIDVLQHFFKRERKEEGEFDAEDYMSQKGEFVSHVEFFINVGDGKFGFEEDAMDMFFASFGGRSDFQGEAEIEKVGHDLNERFPDELKRAFYREQEVERVSSIIYQKDNSPIAIIGREGVGKKSILEEAIYQHITEHSTKISNTYNLEKVWLIDPTRIITGMSIIGMWQKRFEAILNYVRNRRKAFKYRKGYTDKIVFTNVVAMLRIGRSAQNDMTLSDVLKPYLEKRELQAILVATPEQWKLLQDKDRRFADLFQVVRIEQPDLETATKMVFRQRNILEIEQGCQIGIPAIVELFAIYRNYLKSNALPGGVMKILRQLAVKYRFKPVDVSEVRQEFETLSGLNEVIFDRNRTIEDKDLREHMNAMLIGQPDAVESLVDIVHLIKAKLNTPNKPLGSFMFIGPTGVGKTQAAKVLCQYLLGSDEYLTRFDMNEYIDGNAVERLIGDYNRPEGQLTGKVRYRPFGIVLLDEIEKANPAVHDLLLQVLDDGRLTDSVGRTVDFSNTIIIMTSNVGATDVNATVGFKTSSTDLSAVYRKAMEATFRPEFINRINKVVIFQSLLREHIHKIARLQINELLRRDGFVRRSTILNIAPKALEWVADRGYNEQMGGRALKRQIEQDLTALSAEQLIRTNADRPIIFEILLRDNQLMPHIITLAHTEPLVGDWLPKLPTEKEGRRFYGRLLKMVEQMLQRLHELDDEMSGENDDNFNVYSFGAPEDIENEATEPIGAEQGEADDDWMYFDFKNKLTDLKESLKEVILGFRNKYYVERPVLPLRLKRIKKLSFLQNTEGSAYRNTMKDKDFQQSGLEEISASYSFAASEFDRMASQFMDFFMEVALLQNALDAVIEDRVDRIQLSFYSYIEALGKDQIDFLIEMYQRIFKELTTHFEFDEENKIFTLEGYNVFELWQCEHGIHLFQIPHQNPMPIKVDVKLLPDPTATSEATTATNTAASDASEIKVVRIYGLQTITDLRTNFTNARNISTNEFKILLYGALPNRLLLR